MAKNNTEYSISDLAKEFDVTTRTIRHYEDIGLLAPVRRGQSRVYGAADRTRLRLILRGKRLGLSLDQAREIIDMYEPGKRNVAQLNRLIKAISGQREKLHRQRDDIANMLDELNRVEMNCVSALQEMTTNKTSSKPN